VQVAIGERVATGQEIGAMGKVGPRGRPHLHWEVKTAAQYRHWPYGVRGLDPNQLLHGERGATMTAAAPMARSAIQVASLDGSLPVAERPRIKRRHGYRHRRYRHHHYGHA